MITSLITALYLLGIVPPETAYTFLYVCGGLLIVGEIAFGGHGLIALNGLIALFVGYAIQTGNHYLFGIHIDWGVLFGLTFVEACVLVASTLIYLHYRKIRASTGTESMVGQRAEIISWNGTHGKVRIQGETWKAKSDAEIQPSVKEVTVNSVDGLTVKVNA